MRIVDRKTFLALPVGTLYSKMPLDPNTYDFGPVLIKGETTGNDWWVQQLVGDIVGASDAAQWIDAIDEMRAGKQRFVDYNIEGRDGLFDEDQTFAVFGMVDYRMLISRLTEAHRSASA